MRSHQHFEMQTYQWLFNHCMLLHSFVLELVAHGLIMVIAVDLCFLRRTKTNYIKLVSLQLVLITLVLILITLVKLLTCFLMKYVLPTFSDFVAYTRVSSYCDWIHEKTNQEVSCVSLGMNRTPRPPPPPQEPTAPAHVEPIPDANTDVPPESLPLVEGEEESPKSSVKHGAASAFMTFWMVFAFHIFH